MCVLLTLPIGGGRLIALPLLLFAALMAEFLRGRRVTRLDLLVHCAGVGSYGPAEAQEPEQIDALLDTKLSDRRIAAQVKLAFTSRAQVAVWAASQNLRT